MQANQTRAAVLYGPGDLRVETRDVPAPGAGEVVLQVAVSGICGTDLHYWDGWQFDSWFPESDPTHGFPGMSSPPWCRRSAQAIA